MFTLVSYISDLCALPVVAMFSCVYERCLLYLAKSKGKAEIFQTWDIAIKI